MPDDVSCLNEQADINSEEFPLELRDYLLDAIAHRRVDDAASPERSVDDAAFLHMRQSFRLHAASVLNQFAETTDEDLDEGETLADRLLVLLAQGVSEDGYRQFNDTEQEMYGSVLTAAAEYMQMHGVGPQDVAELLDGWSEDAAIRVRDTLAASLPEGDAVMDEITQFAFGLGAQVSLDAVYKELISFQDGKKIIRRKRVAGLAKVLTQKQKTALAATRKRSHTSAANRARKKSVRARVKSGIGMKRKPA